MPGRKYSGLLFRFPSPQADSRRRVVAPLPLLRADKTSAEDPKATLALQKWSPPSNRLGNALKGGRGMTTRKNYASAPSPSRRAYRRDRWQRPLTYYRPARFLEAHPATPLPCHPYRSPTRNTPFVADVVRPHRANCSVVCRDRH